jgi:hypothetical protein
MRSAPRGWVNSGYSDVDRGSKPEGRGRLFREGTWSRRLALPVSEGGASELIARTSRALAFTRKR